MTRFLKAAVLPAAGFLALAGLGASPAQAEAFYFHNSTKYCMQVYLYSSIGAAIDNVGVGSFKVSAPVGFSGGKKVVYLGHATIEYRYYPNPTNGGTDCWGKTVATKNASQKYSTSGRKDINITIPAP